MRGQRTRLEAAHGANVWTKKSDIELFTKQIMTSNEDAEIRKHVYKAVRPPLSTTPYKYR